MTFSEFLYTLIFLLLAILLGYFLSKYLNPESKWELIESNVKRKKTVNNPILDYESITIVYGDVYRKQKRNGTYIYKYVER